MSRPTLPATDGLQSEARPFWDYAHLWRAYGLPVLPVDRMSKSPLVKGFAKWRAPPSDDTTEKWRQKHGAANIGIVTGKASGITVIDVDDANDKALLHDVERRFGATPVIVASGSGKSQHFYYRHAGERCKTRVDGQPVDVRGDSGFIVAPGSVHGATGLPYRFLRGSFEDLSQLAEIPPGSLQPRPSQCKSGELIAALSGDLPVSDLQRDRATEGCRNDRLFRQAVALARDADSEPELFAAVSALNSTLCDPPLATEEVVRIAASSWRYKVEGRLWIETGGVFLPNVVVEQLIKAPGEDLRVLVCALRHHFGVHDTFALSPEAMAASKCLGSLGERRIRQAGASLVSRGFLRVTHQGGTGRGDCRMYAFGPAFASGKGKRLPPRK